MQRDLKWKLISSEYVFKDEWLTARKDVCERPDGKIIDPYYVLEYANWVSAVALTRDNQVVLIRQYRHAWGDVCLELPGGCVDPADKSMEEAMLRELKEETGYTFNEIESLGIITPNPASNSNHMTIFLVKGGVKTDDQNLDHNEDIEVLLVPLDELLSYVEKGEIHEAMHISCVYKALQRLGKIGVK